MAVLVDYSKWKGAAVTLTLLALVMSMIAFMSTAWGVPSEIDYNDMFEGLGLWKYCRQNEDGSSNCKDTIGLDTPGWYRDTQAVMTVAFILIFASQVVIIIAECVKRCRPNPGIVIAYVVVNLISVIFQVCGVGIFGAEIAGHTFSIDDAEDLRLKVSWSYILAAVAAGLQLFAAFFAICELIFSKRARRPMASSGGVHNVEMDASVESSTSRYEGF